MKKTVQNLDVLDLTRSNSILWLGNGINRAFQSDSWEKIITDVMDKNKVEATYEDIKSMPANMQIIVASNDNVNVEMKHLSSQINELCLDEQLMTFLKNYLLDTDISTIITTNYSYEIERAIYDNYSFAPTNISRKISKEVTATERSSLLYNYNNLLYNSKPKNIWHIHGENCSPTKMIMGNYYYGKLLYRIQEYIGKRMSVLKTAYEKKTAIKPLSWIDYFLLCDVYVLGFGMDMSEVDFWWLVCCKKRNFPDTNVWVYEANISESIAKQKLLDAYNVKIKSEENIKGNEEYKRFYINCCNDIKEMINMHKVN